ncbi:MAG: hypothetical protein ACRDG7_14780 [Candidatus Limnocylindria bacterium]
MTLDTLASTGPEATTATPAWPVFAAPLMSREIVADRTMSFPFTKPSDWSYRAGQSVDITLLDARETDAEGNMRGFSISSAPRERGACSHRCGHASALPRQPLQSDLLRDLSRRNGPGRASDAR